MKYIQEDINAYLVFKVGTEEFAVNASRVQRILEMQAITHIPRAPEYIRGIINLMGKPLPVINTRKKIGLEEKEDDNKTSIIILELFNTDEVIETGIVVDSVQSVIEIEKEKIQDAPEFSMEVNTDFILGVVEHENKFLIVLNVDKIFSTTEIISLKNTVSDL